MSATEQKGVGMKWRFDEQKSCTFWAMHLMGADGHQICIELVDIFKRFFTEPLDSVSVEQDPTLSTEASQFGNGLDRPDFIVGCHDRHQNCVRTDCLFEVLHRHDPFMIYWEVCYFEALPLGKVRTAMENGVV